MALEKIDTIDAVGIESTTGYVVLTIADQWDWKDERQHLVALQAKLNAYFKYIETGQVLESYPQAVGRQLVIDVVGKFPIPQVGLDLLQHASAISSELRVSIRNRFYPGLEKVEPV